MLVNTMKIGFNMEIKIGMLYLFQQSWIRSKEILNYDTRMSVTSFVRIVKEKITKKDTNCR